MKISLKKMCKEIYINNNDQIVSHEQVTTMTRKKLPKIKVGRKLEENQTQLGVHPHLGDI